MVSKKEKRNIACASKNSYDVEIQSKHFLGSFLISLKLGCKEAGLGLVGCRLSYGLLMQCILCGSTVYYLFLRFFVLEC